MVYLRGRVKFPTGGDKRLVFSCFKPASLIVLFSWILTAVRYNRAGFGANPKPTVKSGWEKMEVLRTFKKYLLIERFLRMSL